MTDRRHPEFSRPIPVDRVMSDGYAFDFCANENERRALARRFDLAALDRLSVEGVLEAHGRGGRVRMRARLVADAAQACVVTLKPIPVHIEAPVTRLYDPAMLDEWGGDGAEIVLTSAEDVEREPLTASTVDPADAAADQLGLELDAFPRAEDAEFAGYGAANDAGDEDAAANSPFARLRDIIGTSSQER